MYPWIQNPEEEEEEFQPEFGPQSVLNPNVRDLIAKKYNLTDDVAAAQQQAVEAQFGDDLARAGAMIGAALSGPGVKVDEGFWTGKAARNQQGVKDAIALQQAADSDVERQERDKSIADQDSARVEKAKLADPNNKLAVLARSKLKEIGFPVADNASLADIKASGINPFDLFNSVKQRELENKLRAEDRELRRIDANDRADERALIREERKAEREEKLEEKREEKLREREVPGVGIAMTKQDAKDLKSATEMKAKFDRTLSEMIALRKKHNGGAVLNREDVSRGQQLSKDLLLTYKDLAKLGVLSQADEAILNKIIPEDPLEYNISGLIGQDPTMGRLKKFQEDSEKDYQTRLATRLESREEKPKTADSSKPTYAPGSRVKVKGAWYIVGEDGDELIPETQTAGK